jgi:hypothetical protein
MRRPRPRAARLREEERLRDEARRKQENEEAGVVVPPEDEGSGISPEEYVASQGVDRAVPGYAIQRVRPKLDPVIESEALARIDEIRDFERRYDAAEDWHARARLRAKRPEPYAERGESFQQAAERGLRGYDHWYSSELLTRIDEQQEIEDLARREAARKLIEEGGAFTGRWALERESGLEHPRQGEPNRISESSKVGVRERLRFAAKVGKDALSRDQDES